MDGPTEIPAVVVRCVECNYQLTIAGGVVPEKCEKCGRKMERRPGDAVVIIEQVERKENAGQIEAVSPDGA